MHTRREAGNTSLFRHAPRRIPKNAAEAGKKKFQLPTDLALSYGRTTPNQPAKTVHFGEDGKASKTAKIDRKSHFSPMQGNLNVLPA